MNACDPIKYSMTQQDTQILLIDDDEVDVRTVRRAFSRAGVDSQIHVVSNGLDALSSLRTASIKEPILILLDLNMPKMNGFEFLDQLRADPELKHHVVFVLSTSDAERDLRGAYQRYAAGYLVKSEIGTQPEILTQLLSSYLAAVHLPS